MTNVRNIFSSRNQRRPALKLADVEYRVLWNETAQGWEVLRNGTVTSVSARKKIVSAIALAIRDAKSELEISKATVLVTCLQGGKLQTKWKRSKPQDLTAAH